MKKKCYGDECYKNNIKYDDNQLYKYKSKNYCLFHYKKIKEDDKQRQELINCIKHVYKVRYPTGLMLSQIKKMKINNGYSYIGMKETILLLDSKNNIVLDSKYGLGLVPYYYEEARELYRKRINSKTENKPIIKKRKIPISFSRVTENTYKNKNKKYNLE